MIPNLADKIMFENREIYPLEKIIQLALHDSNIKVILKYRDYGSYAAQTWVWRFTINEEDQDEYDLIVFPNYDMLLERHNIRTKQSKFFKIHNMLQIYVSLIQWNLVEDFHMRFLQV